MKSLYDILGIHKSSGKRAVNVDKPCEKETSVLKGRFKIQKSEDDKRLAFGWASIAIDENGEQLVDWQEHIISSDSTGRAERCMSVATARHWLKA